MRHESKVMAALWIALGLLLFAWCPVRGQGGAPLEIPKSFKVAGLEQVSPKTEWLNWFHEAEKCVGREADDNPRDVTWYIYDHMDYVGGSRPLPVVGLYLPGERTILLQKWLSNESWLVKHESLHMILLDNGIGNPNGSSHQIHEPYMKLCAPKPEGMD